MTSQQNDNPNDFNNQEIPAVDTGAGKRLSLQFLQSVPEEQVWLAGQLSPHTRRAYKQDVAHFVQAMGIRSAGELRQVNRAAIVACRTS